MHKYLGLSTTEDDLIPHSVDSTTFSPLQQITRQHHSWPYLEKEYMEVTSEDDYVTIKKEDKVLSSDEKPLSPILEGLV